MKRLILFVSAILVGLHAMAWGPMGHRIVAQVAYHYLTDSTIAQLDNELGTHGLVYWSTWPDEIRSDKELYSTSYDWHFQDLNSGLSDERVCHLMRVYPCHGGRMWQAVDELGKAVSALSDTCVVLKETMPRHDALVFWTHLLADRLCPMHIARENDKGGNLVEIQWFGQTTNLHAVWDEKLIESQGYSYSEYAQMLVDTYGSTAEEIRQLSIEQCVLMTYHTTSDIYSYQKDWNGNGYTFKWDWTEKCNRLLFMAGIQLAKEIEALYTK